MVVVAIIGILLSFLIPMMRGASGGSRRAKCMSFQKELVIGAVAYQTDHGKSCTCCFVYTKRRNDCHASHGMTRKRCGNTSMFPQTKWFARITLLQLAQQLDYNYNTSFIGDEDYLFADAVKGVIPSECKHPASCAMFGDCSKNKFMRSPEIDAIYDPYTDSSTRCAGMQAFRHLDSTNVAWLDGHIDSTTNRFNDCTDELNIGFLGEDNSHSTTHALFQLLKTKIHNGRVLLEHFI